MTPALRAVLVAFLVFTVYFVAGSLVSDSMRFPYGYVSLGAIVLFLLTGFLIARHYSILAAAGATAAAALLASLAAWMVTALVNPVRAPTPAPQTDAIGEVVILMTMAGLVLGGIGASIGHGRTGRARP